MSGLGRIIFDYFSFIFTKENKKARKIRFAPKASRQTKSIDAIEDVIMKNRKRSVENEAYLNLRRYQSMPQIDSLEETNAIDDNRGLNISGKYTPPDIHHIEIFDRLQKSERTNKMQANSRINQEVRHLRSEIDIEDIEGQRQNSFQSETSLNFNKNHLSLPQVDCCEENNAINFNGNLNTPSKNTMPDMDQNVEFGRHQESDKINPFQESSKSRNNQEIRYVGSNKNREIEKQNRRCSCQCKACLNTNRHQSSPQLESHKIANATDSYCRQRNFSKYTLPNESQIEAFIRLKNQFKDPSNFRNQRENCPSDDSGVVCDVSRKTSSVDTFPNHASVYFDAVPWFQREFEHADAKIFGARSKHNFEDVSLKSMKCSSEGEAYLCFHSHQFLPQLDEVTNTTNVTRARNSFDKYKHQKEGLDQQRLSEGREIEFCKENLREKKLNDPWSSIGFTNPRTKKDLTLRRVKSADVNIGKMDYARKEVERRDPKCLISVDQSFCQSRIPVYKTKKQFRNKTKYRCDGRFGWSIFCSKRLTENSRMGISIAHKSLLNTIFEKKFPEFTKKIYRGNIMDYVSHSKWMKQAGIYQEENAAGFKRYAQNKVVLTLPEYKEALAKICEDYGLDYWDVLIKMTNVSPKSNNNSFSDVSSD